MTASSIYQIDYAVALLGKRKDDSKREIRWRYGYTGDDSGDSQEVEVIFTWAVASGKQSIEVNGKEEYFMKKSGATVFDYKFETEFGHELQVVATRVPPNNAGSSFRSYELLIFGKSFFTYPRAGESMTERNEYVATSDSGPSSILDILYPEKSAFHEKDEYVVVFEPSSPTRAAYRVDEHHHDGGETNLLL